MTNPLTAEELAAHLRTYCDGIQGKNELKVGILMCNAAMSDAADLITAQAAEIERLTREVEKEGRAHSITIDQRDAAEEALGNAYTIVTGQVPEWSNLFDYNAALLEIEEASARAIAAEAKVAALTEALKPFSRLEGPKHPQSNAGAFVVLFSDIKRASAALGAKP